MRKIVRFSEAKDELIVRRIERNSINARRYKTVQMAGDHLTKRDGAWMYNDARLMDDEVFNSVSNAYLKTS